ncbi:hypothetical protein BDV98DRAFT_568522 [Pterulicium gracile]|uniref:Uncharacterized protein n=1 Tax=Pterulicium gracile TaxID=1884261 RepID=A0A5C3QJ00_9AGAR|nr:hypothetical protein BDV98DRAFT_568522 [Pterula gracilis]
MSEFDDSPAALEGIRKANRRVRQWRDHCEGQAGELKNPYEATVRASSYASSGSSSSSAAFSPREYYERGWPTTHAQARDWHGDSYGYHGGAYGGDKFSTSRNVSPPVIYSPSCHQHRYSDGVGSPHPFPPPGPAPYVIAGPHGLPSVIPGGLTPNTGSHGEFSPNRHSHQWAYSGTPSTTRYPDHSGRSRTVLRDVGRRRSQSQNPSHRRRGRSRSRERDHHCGKHRSSSLHRHHLSSSHHRHHQHHRAPFPPVGSPTNLHHPPPSAFSSPTSQVYSSCVHPSTTTASYHPLSPPLHPPTTAYTHSQAPLIVIPQGYQVVQRNTPGPVSSSHSAGPGFGYGGNGSASKSSWLSRLRVNPFGGKEAQVQRLPHREEGWGGVQGVGDGVRGKRHQLVMMRRRSGTL